MLRKLLVVTTIIFFSACDKLKKIPYDPPLKSTDWCANQPCSELGDLIISQPSSSAIVYILSILSIAIGVFFLKKNKGQQSIKWWGYSIIIGGIGALFAGTSYQAFGYELKCAGRQYCIYTNWWELWYEILTIASAGALLIGISYSCFSLKWQNICKGFAIINTLTYLVVIFLGVYSVNKFLLSFELMICFIAPTYILIMICNIIDYTRIKKQLLKKLIVSWLILFSTLGAYYLYMITGITQKLWESNIWLSDNDVLHLGMIGWILYLYFELYDNLTDIRQAH
jgi:hypothetical protein